MTKVATKYRHLTISCHIARRQSIKHTSEIDGRAIAYSIDMRRVRTS